MKLNGSIVLLLQLLKTSAQQGLPTLHISKLDDIKGNTVTNQVLSQLAMGFAEAGQPQPKGQSLTAGNNDNSGSSEIASGLTSGIGIGDIGGGGGGTDLGGSSGSIMGSDSEGSGGNDAPHEKLARDL